MSEFRALVKEHPTRLFMIVEDKVVDVTQFINEHPGGPRMMKMFTGKDGTPGFLGGWNFHSKSAHLKLKQLQMGTFIQGSESDEECDDYDLDGKNEGVLVGQSDHAKED